MKLTAFAKYAWGFVAYNLIVIMWGAFVRATGSGAGCGEHWPTCQGNIIPQSPELKTLIEYSHRLTSGLALIGVVVLFIWAWRAYAPRHIVRKAAAWSLFFMLTEALLGASLVLLRYVEDDVSMGRLISMPVHLFNTFLLVGAISLTAWWASWGKPWDLKSEAKVKRKMAGAIGFLLVIGMSGAITALGDTLFPVGQDYQSNVHSFAAQILVDFRIFHPIIAVLSGLYIIFMAIHYERNGGDRETRFLGRSLTFLFLFQLLVGTANVILRAPVWLQLFHLLVADLVWISLVLLTAKVLTKEE